MSHDKTAGSGTVPTTRAPRRPMAATVGLPAFGGLPYAKHYVFVGSATVPTTGPIMTRKNIRLARTNYEIPSRIFSITICTWNRRPLFKNRTCAQSITASVHTGPFGKCTDRYAFCLMPDHLHLQMAPLQGNLIDHITKWKSFTGSLLRSEGLQGSCWQRGFYDHALRKEEDLRTVAEYIVHNPVRAGIVASWREYPYSWPRWI
jgi:putative transposase